MQQLDLFGDVLVLLDQVELFVYYYLLVALSPFPPPPPGHVSQKHRQSGGQEPDVAPLRTTCHRDEQHGVEAQGQRRRRAAQIPLGQLIGAPADGVDVQFTHHTAVHLQRRNAVVLLQEVAQVVRPLGQGAVEKRVNVAATREVIVDELQVLHAVHDDGVRIGRLQDMVAEELQVLYGRGGGEVELLDRVDFVVQNLQSLDLGESCEGVGADHTQIGLLERE